MSHTDIRWLITSNIPGWPSDSTHLRNSIDFSFHCLFISSGLVRIKSPRNLKASFLLTKKYQENKIKRKG